MVLLKDKSGAYKVYIIFAQPISNITNAAAVI